ncbi:hypothetical protein B9479_004834 [Cryptococcus floricola]|uniref:NADP-dependent oxidoreductase domain-containing protein n=1 Tax=Cryptococcus floricola TaxID=2591691 RepID=A0A5D3AWN3_9TREE|nr:hypothetical protein B9479_004834 [Cryptococcus floricola]
MPFTQITLNDGRKMPAIAFGTANIPDPASNISQAIKVGFTHIDTAQNYGTETDVGLAIKSTDLPRRDLWITTKWSNVDDKTPRQSITESLEKLGVEYVDLYLIHSPSFQKGRGEIQDWWRDFESLYEEGLAKSIGVSNFTKEQMEELLRHATVKPVVNQIFLHPYNIVTQGPLLAYLAEQNIVTEGYSTLTPLTSMPGGPVDKPVEEIAKRLGKTPEQVLLAWSKAKGVVIVTTSCKKDRLESYLEVGDITLSPEDVDAIDEAGKAAFVGVVN